MSLPLTLLSQLYENMAPRPGAAGQVSSAPRQDGMQLPPVGAGTLDLHAQPSPSETPATATTQESASSGSLDMLNSMAEMAGQNKKKSETGTPQPDLSYPVRNYWHYVNPSEPDTSGYNADEHRIWNELPDRDSSDVSEIKLPGIVNDKKMDRNDFLITRRHGTYQADPNVMAQENAGTEQLAHNADSDMVKLYPGLARLGMLPPAQVPVPTAPPMPATQKTTTEVIHGVPPQNTRVGGSGSSAKSKTVSYDIAIRPVTGEGLGNESNVAAASLPDHTYDVQHRIENAQGKQLSSTQQTELQGYIDERQKNIDSLKDKINGATQTGGVPGLYDYVYNTWLKKYGGDIDKFRALDPSTKSHTQDYSDALSYWNKIENAAKAKKLGYQFPLTGGLKIDRDDLLSYIKGMKHYVFGYSVQ